MSDFIRMKAYKVIVNRLNLMRWCFVGLVVVSAATPTLAQQTSDPCLQAVDYKGCKEYQNPTTPHRVVVDPPNDYEYKAESVRRQQVRGAYGRYLTFVGMTLNAYVGTPARWNPGQPGTKQCNTIYGFNNSKTTTCRNVGYVPPSYTPATPGGVERRSFRYLLDCEDRTFDRQGDFSGFGNKGWLTVDDDPTALAVADRYCPIINSLPRQEPKQKRQKSRLAR